MRARTSVLDSTMTITSTSAITSMQQQVTHILHSWLFHAPLHAIPCHTAWFHAIPHEPITHNSLAIERFHCLNPPSNLFIFLSIPFTTLFFSTTTLLPHYHSHHHLHICTYPWTYVLTVAAKFDNNWGRKFHERVLLLVRDIANPSGEDPYFPAWRHKDW